MIGKDIIDQFKDLGVDLMPKIIAMTLILEKLE